MLKRVLFLLLVVVAHSSIYAQWVTVTDTLFADWLNGLQWNCMNGNKLDTTCPELLAATSLIITPSSGIKNIDAIRYFKNLEELTCRNNQLTELRNLPLRIKTLDCRFNKIENIELSDSLRILTIADNKLDSLINIPFGLKYLQCDGNELTFIDTLPDNLTWMSCRLNKLIELPELPAALSWLSCEGNDINSLPFLPQSLRSLHCGINKIHTISSLPDSLEWFSCYDNFIDSLPALPSTLVDLMCWNNAIKILPAIPVGLSGLVCYGNQLSEIPDLPAVMDVLDIHNNTGITCLPYIKKVNRFWYGGTGLTCIPSHIDIGLSYPTIYSNFICNSTNNTHNCPLYISSNSFIERELQFTVSPNPVPTYLQVELNESEPVKFIITDVSGRKMQEHTTTTLLSRIDVSGLAGGMYYISYTHNGKSATKRFVKE